MYNNFVVIGPLADPAHIARGKDLIESATISTISGSKLSTNSMAVLKAWTKSASEPMYRSKNEWTTLQRGEHGGLAYTDCSSSWN
jgi:ABC-type tungstate transport system permease subunit